MNIGVLRVLGVWVLLVAMVFALVRLDTADQWVAWWAPFVVLGVVLVFLGRIVGRKSKRGDSGPV